MRMRITGLMALLIAGTLAVLPMATAAQDQELSAARSFEIPGEEVYPEGIAYDSEAGTFYVGATADGTIFEGDIESGVVEVLSGGDEGQRPTAIGLELADDGTLYIAGGPSGTVFTLDPETGEPGESYAHNVTGEGETFLNDLVATEEGQVYVTDSFGPTIWTIGAGGLEPWLDLTDSPIAYEDGFNLNGIVLSPNESAILVVQANTGLLYRIKLESQRIEQVDLGGELLTGGDGMVLDGLNLYVVRDGGVTIVRMDENLLTGQIVGNITDPAFSSPTTAAQAGACLLVVNSQFANQGNPELPFTVSGIAIPAENLATPAAPEDVIGCAVG